MTADCGAFLELMDGYLDNELDTDTVYRVRKHLSGCATCRRRYRETQLLIDSTRTQVSYYKAPKDLVDTITRDFGGRKTAPPRKLFWRRWMLAIPAAALALTLLVYVGLPGQRRGIDDELVSSHIRSLLEQHLTDVASSDSHTVKPWFAGKLDFSPPVYDFAAQGYPLIGGRLDYLQHRVAAALAYGRNKHLINVFIMPEAGIDKPFKIGALRGYNFIFWRKGGLSFFAVSDLNARELEALAVLLDRQS